MDQRSLGRTVQREGKIRAFGSSTFPAHEVVEAQWLTTDVLDRIDEIVPPGVTVARGDEATSRRRSPTLSCGAAAPDDGR